ncbi:MAG: hypothetical protein U1E23_08190 [Reyranellaceae bacterium]
MRAGATPGLLLAVATLATVATAPVLAQSRPAASPVAGAASARVHLQALHYQDVRDLRRDYTGQWVATARQGGVPKQVTVAPDGTVIAR